MQIPISTRFRQLSVRYVPQVVLDAVQRWRVRRWIAAGKPIPLPAPFKQSIVRQYATKYNLKILIETGTFYGDMVAACKSDFSRIFSIELQESLYLRARKRFSRDPHITILQGDSATELPRALAQLKEPALFWLDAHYSGGVTARSMSETPIVKELDMIFASSLKPLVVLIDDARCFDGTHDYPTLEYVASRAHAQAYSCEVLDDVIRIAPTTGPVMKLSNIKN